MTGAVMVLAASVKRSAQITEAGALSAPATGGLNPTGTARVMTVPAGNSGNVKFSGLTQMGAGGAGLQYKLNAGAFTAVTEGLTITLANGDTLQMKDTSCAASGDGDMCQFTDVDAAHVIETIQCYR